MLITIDGVHGQGKSTIAKMIANDLCLRYVDSGMLYRLITYCYVNLCGAHNDIIDPIILKKSMVMFKDKTIDDINENELRTNTITTFTNIIAALPCIRSFINNHIIEIIKDENAILVGRDMCLLFPQADHKFVFKPSFCLRVNLALRNFNINEADAVRYITSRDNSEIQVDYPEDCLVVALDEKCNNLDAIVKYIENIIAYRK